MDFRAIFMGLFFAIIWSSAFTSARIIVLQAPALTISSLRFFSAGMLAIAIAYALGQRIRLDHKRWQAVIIFGICQNALYLGLLFVGLQRIEASLAIIIASALPLIVGLACTVFMGERLGRLGWFGLITGFAGVGLIMVVRVSKGIDLFGVLLCFIGVCALATATILVRTAIAQGNMLMVVGLQMLVGGAALLIPALLLEEQSFIWTGSLIAALSYTIIMPGIIGTMIWFSLIERIGATRASAFHFLNPFFGVVIAVVVLGENLELTDVIGVAIVMAGILAVQVSRGNS